jgi:hypothetical protein
MMLITFRGVLYSSCVGIPSCLAIHFEAVSWEPIMMYDAVSISSITLF